MKSTFGLMLAVFLFTGAARAESPAVAGMDLKQYLTQLQLKIDHSAQRSNQPTANGSSVVGLRGSKQVAASQQLYWKGKQTTAPVTPEEIRVFRGAIDQAQAGQNASALAALKSFEDKYPKSALRPDADETIQRLSAASVVRPAVSTPSVEPVAPTPAKS